MKKKKILFGLTLGALMATTPFATACSSDITFNQTDLDNAIKNVNEYLETQNNYSSEFAKNVLNDYLLRGIERNQNNSQFGYKVTNEAQNALNDRLKAFVVDYKVFRNENTFKELCNITYNGNSHIIGKLDPNTNNYREITCEYKNIINEPGSTLVSVGKTHYYSGTTYSEDLNKTENQYSKTTFEDREIDDLENWRVFGDLSDIYTDLMLAVVSPEASSMGPGVCLSNQSDVVMGQDGEFETFTFTNVFVEESGSNVGVGVLSFNLKFKNGVLCSIKFTNSMKEDASTTLDVSQIMTIEITENINDFTFDKSNYQ